MSIDRLREAKKRIARADGLDALDLSNLGLTSDDLGSLLPKLCRLTALTTLWLDGNQLAVLPESLGNLTALTTLWLSGNQLAVLPESLGNLTALTDLRLTYNQLAGLPESLGNLTALTDLRLDGNQLAVLPETLGNLTALTDLRLNDNQLAGLPETLGNLIALTTLWLSGNQLAGLPETLGNLTALTTLGLSGNQLAVLPETLGNLTALTTLWLDGNQLAVLPETLGNLTALTDLRLDGNQLAVLPESLGNLTALTTLWLSGNQLAVLPETLGNLTALTDLRLNDNQLAVLPETLGNLTALTTLGLSGNQLAVLPESLGNLTALTTLGLSGNQLAVLPESLGNLTALTDLRLDGNQLAGLPETLGNLIALTTLWLSGNQLAGLPETLGNLTALTSLWLDGNQLAVLPETLGNLTALTILWLDGNQLAGLPETLGNLTALTILGLSGNQLAVLPETLGNLTALTTLGLSGNQLAVLPETLGNLTALTTLWLNDNQLAVLPETLGNLTALTSLRLNDNQLAVLPETLGNLTALTDLGLNDNQLAVLPETLGNLTALTDLRLDGNQLAPEIQAAAAEGAGEVQAFLRLLRAEGVDVAEAKLVLVGEGAAGKSSLLGALRGDAWVEGRGQTHGMQIKPVQMACDGQTITLNGWDFGGQRHYRPAHQLFFTAPAVYVVVWNPRAGKAQSLVEDWLAMIAHRAGPEARVHVVATYGGPASRADALDEAALRDRFPGLIDSFHDVDSAITSDGRLDALKAAITATAAGLLHVRRRYPANWLTAIEALAKTGEQSVPYSQYETIAGQHGIPAGQARSLARNAHTLGTWVYYDDEPALREVVVLKPAWLSVAIARVLEDPQAVDELGLVTHRRFADLWANPADPASPRYTHAQQQVFLRLMERFELTYRVPELTGDEPTSLVAQLVPAGRPDLSQVWDDFRPGEPEAVEICQAIEEGAGRDRVVVPEGLIYRLIVRLHHQRLPRPGAPQGTHWQGGLLTQSRYGARALINVTPDGLKVTVRGPDPGTFLRQSADEILRCIDGGFWKGLTSRALVPCRDTCAQGTPGRALFDVEWLITARDQHHRRDVDCTDRRCFAQLNIDTLLGGRDPFPAHDTTQTLAALTRLGDQVEQLTRGITTDVADVAERLKVTLGQFDAAMTNFLRGLDDDAAGGPRLFTLEPLDATLRHPGWTTKRMRLTLFCEHSRLPVHVLEPGNPHAGVYDVDVPRDWWMKALPILKFTTALLKPLIGVGLADLKMDMSKAQLEAAGSQLDLIKESVGAAADAAKALSGTDDTEGLSAEAGDARHALRAEGSVLRTLHAMIQAQDPGLADLRKVRDPQQQILWVHRTFVPYYQPPLPNIPTAPSS